MSKISKYIIVFYQENLDLAKAEFFSVFSTARLLISDKNKILIESQKLKLKPLAFTKEILVICPKGIDVTIARQSFNAKKVFCGQHNTSKHSLKFSDDKSPVAIPPKLALAMVNLASPVKSQSNNMQIVDPFCGTGGILLEAALIGYKVKGYDLCQKTLEQAKKRFVMFNLKQNNLLYGDALTLKERLPVVVTDLPYGKSTSVGSLILLYKRFLLHVKPLLSGKMVIGFPNFISGQSLVKALGYKVHGAYEWRLHNSLSKTILVLTANIIV